MPRWRLLAMLLVATLTLGTGIGLSAARADDVQDRKRAVDRLLEEVRKDLEGAGEDVVAAALTLRRAQAELAEAQAALASAQAELAAAAERDTQIAAQLALAEAAVAKARRDLAARQQQERDSRAVIGSIARDAYVDAGMSNLAIALNATSPQQFADRVSAAGTALRRQRGTLARLEVEQAETRTRQVQLGASLALVAELKRESAALVVRKRTVQGQAATAQTLVARTVQQRQAALAAVNARKATEQKRLTALTAEQKKLADILRRRAADTPGAGSDLSGGGRLAYPVNAPVTSAYGMRFHPVLQYWRLHAGTDFGAGCGTPVRSPASGTVVRAGWAGGFGNQVLVDHGRISGRQLASSVNHLSRIVRSGGRVERGELIGYAGTTGLSTGCHLHFEVYVDGNTVNPMSWL